MIVVTNNDRMGKNIQYLRQKQNLSLEVFAQLTGIDSNTLNALEKGVLMEIPAQVLTVICEQLQVSVKTLVEDPLE